MNVATGERLRKRPRHDEDAPLDFHDLLLPTFEVMYRHQKPTQFAEKHEEFLKTVENPMELSSIQRKLKGRLYHDPWEYITDVWVMFGNAKLFFHPISNLYKYYRQLTSLFEKKITEVMIKLGYCCGSYYKFSPLVLHCYGKENCTIPKMKKYNSYKNKYGLCQNCFDNSPDPIPIRDDAQQLNRSIQKSKFNILLNDYSELEPFVTCVLCAKRYHQICVLHLDLTKDYKCKNCQNVNNTSIINYSLTARDLPTSTLSKRIESRVNNFLREKNSTTGYVSIRVVFASEKIIQVKPEIKRALDVSQDFPCRMKVLFAFQQIDDVDVCFFGLHVYEYGSDCPNPNKRKVYIGYIDSVNLFSPRSFRTEVYHEILLDYFEYVKRLGFSTIHIWACPPIRGDDYIFYSHPTDQQFPDSKKLQQWYKNVFIKGMERGIILDFKNIVQYAHDENWTTAMDVPYFQGDYWPDVIEKSIKDIDEEKTKRPVLTAVNRGPGRPGRKSKNGQLGKKGGESINLYDRVLATMKDHSNSFLIVQLHSRTALLKEIKDPDPYLSCDLMDGRLKFLAFGQENNFEFSSLRRAKFSTMMMLKEIQKQHLIGFNKDNTLMKRQDSVKMPKPPVSIDTDICSQCHTQIALGRRDYFLYRNFELCFDCYQEQKHKKPQSQNMSPASTLSLDDKASSPSSRRKYNLLFIHVCYCSDIHCTEPNCRKMKKIISHTKKCPRIKSGCEICRHLKTLINYHATHCDQENCRVLFCSDLKNKYARKQRERSVSVKLIEAQEQKEALHLPTDYTLPQGQLLLNHFLQTLECNSDAERSQKLMKLLTSSPPLRKDFQEYRQHQSSNVPPSG